jgi:glucose-1-phosphate cytidylyltransferase
MRSTNPNTKVVILCGGQGTRIRDVSEVLPKPMLPIGGRPILWHIMKIYAHYGFNEFILCLGYKGWLIKEFFLNYQTINSDFTLTLGNKNSIEFHNGKNNESNWKVTLVDTGEEAKTAKRIWLIRDHLKDSKEFHVTYGDGVADVNVKTLLEMHQRSKSELTVTGVQPLGRFGEIETQGDVISEFNEKPNVSSGVINGGFMVFDTKIFNKYFNEKKNESLESDVIPRIVKDKKANVYRHKGAWQCVDTSREYNFLNELWANNKAFWKVWR